MYCYPQMEQTDFPPQIGVSLAGRNVIRVSHKIKKILWPLTDWKLQIAIATVYRLPKTILFCSKSIFWKAKERYKLNMPNFGLPLLHYWRHLRKTSYLKIKGQCGKGIYNLLTTELDKRKNRATRRKSGKSIPHIKIPRPIAPAIKKSILSEFHYAAILN